MGAGERVGRIWKWVDLTPNSLTLPITISLLCQWPFAPLWKSGGEAQHWFCSSRARTSCPHMNTLDLMTVPRDLLAMPSPQLLGFKSQRIPSASLAALAQGDTVKQFTPSNPQQVAGIPEEGTVPNTKAVTHGGPCWPSQRPPHSQA